jgi:GntR family transcriptional repressor for pyruvate dehydrogenase complex
MTVGLEFEDRGRHVQTLSDHLARGVIALIREQRLTAGDRLPSVKEMSERFRVATPTMREALRLLEMLGNIDIRHGSGIYLRQLEPRLMLTNPYASSLDTAAIVNLLRARSTIEPPIAAQAAANATEAQFAELDAILENAERHLAGNSDADAVLGVVNMQFHRGIASACGNSILAEVVHSLTELHIKEQMAVLDLYNNRRRDHEQHKLILAALKHRDGQKAEDLMLDHLAEVVGVVSERLDAMETPAD